MDLLVGNLGILPLQQSSPKGREHEKLNKYSPQESHVQLAT